MLATLMVSPLVGILLAVLTPKDKGRLAFRLSLASACVPLGLSILLWPPFMSGSILSLLESKPGIPVIGSAYILKLDGLNLVFVTIVAFLVLISVLMSGLENDSRRRFDVLLFFWETALFGAFLAWDYRLFILFWVLSLVPIYIFLKMNDQVPKHVSRLFICFSALGATALGTGLHYLWRSFEVPVSAGETLGNLIPINLDPAAQWWIFLAVFLGSALRMPIFPLHIWLPTVLPHLPRGAGIVLIGGSIPLGLYSLTRFAFAVLPDAGIAFAVFLAAVGVVNMLFGSLAAIGKDHSLGKAGYQAMVYVGTALVAASALTTAGLAAAFFTLVALGLGVAYSLILNPLTPKNLGDEWPLVFHIIDAAKELRLPGFATYVGITLAFAEPVGGLYALRCIVFVTIGFIAIDYGRKLAALIKKTQRTSFINFVKETGFVTLAAVLVLAGSVALGNIPALIMNLVEPAVRRLMSLS
ncbi:MAG: hypothetical protein GX316_05415 [Firmicutes bacterium]|nr:hypothetical protein [Bacillota bacterium]